MHFSQATIAAVVAAGFVSAAPTIEKRAAITDADILQYALTLEHLEDTFYREGLAKYTEEDFKNAGFDSKVYNNVKAIASDEAAHVDFLTKGLKAAGANPTAACTYDFGYKDVKSFLATASILEGVGVSAYTGAAADIMSKTYLTAAASILTVESRHSSYIRASLDQKPFPQAFDTPLSYNEVYSLASGFIKSCPEGNAKLPVKAFPAIAVSAESTKQAIKSGSEVVLQTPGYQLKSSNADAKVYAAFIAVTGPVIVDAVPVDGGYKVKIPDGFAGQTYVVLTSCKDAVNDDTVAAGPAIIEISSRYCNLSWSIHVQRAEAAGVDLPQLVLLLDKLMTAVDHNLSMLLAMVPWRIWPEVHDTVDPLFIALTYGLTHHGKLIIQRPDYMSPGDTPTPVPAYAAERGNVEISRHCWSITALHYAAFKNYAKIARLLLDAGADPHLSIISRDPSSISRLEVLHRTAVGVACQFGNLEVVRELDPSITTSATMNKAMAWALRSGCPRVVALLAAQPLLQINAPVDGMTPLMHASYFHI
ncbi:hypothetical protein PWT90_08367 [Aphanocladium album]|nr:hypothetical protein PWT90_08367 [Aphanocladium album]